MVVEQLKKYFNVATQSFTIKRSSGNYNFKKNYSLLCAVLGTEIVAVLPSGKSDAFPTKSVVFAPVIRNKAVNVQIPPCSFLY